MKRLYFLFIVAAAMISGPATGQSVAYSGFDRDDNRDINFEVIGKMNGNILVYKNIRWKHKLSIYDKEMKDVATINLDFIPEKTFNIDFVAYPDHFYMIYQYQQRSIVHCLGVDMDANGNKISEPVELDTTQIPIMADNKIYTTISSEDRQKIMIFKMQKKWDKLTLVTLLFDNKLKLVDKFRRVSNFNDRRESYDNFSLANDGSFVFTYAKQQGNRDYSSLLNLVTKPPQQDSLSFNDIDLKEKYFDEVKLKIDNLNGNYIVNSFYHAKNRSNVEGLFTCIWSTRTKDVVASMFNNIPDTIRNEANESESWKYALDNFFVRQVIVKKDGSFIMVAEDFSSQGRNNSWNRWDYLYGPYSYYPNSYYMYDPFFNYYRPRNSFFNQSIRYYYENILIMSFDTKGKPEWSRIIHKNQFAEGEDNFLSFNTMITGGEIHFIYNNDKRYQIIANQSISADGTQKRNPTIKSREKGYEFMPKFSKQVGASLVVIPCAYRGNICFALVDFNE